MKRSALTSPRWANRFPWMMAFGSTGIPKSFLKVLYSLSRKCVYSGDISFKITFEASSSVQRSLSSLLHSYTVRNSMFC